MEFIYKHLKKKTVSFSPDIIEISPRLAKKNSSNLNVSINELITYKIDKILLKIKNLDLDLPERIKDGVDIYLDTIKKQKNPIKSLKNQGFNTTEIETIFRIIEL